MTRSLKLLTYVLLMFTLTSLVSAQSPYPGRSSRGGRGGTSRPRANPDSENILPNFDGTVRGIDSKGLTIELPDSNTLEFNCSKKTNYFDGTKKIKPKDIRPGDHVSVEAKPAPDRSLDAVNVRLGHPKPPANQPAAAN